MEVANCRKIVVKLFYYFPPSTGGLSDIDLEDAKSSMVFQPGRSLEEEMWFHGVLPRGEVVRLLEVDGDFLVR